MIGTFGSLVFEVAGTDTQPYILTPKDLTRRGGAEYAYHDALGGRQKRELLRPTLRKVEFAMELNIRFGVKPRKCLDELLTMAEKGYTDYLIIGGKPVCDNKMTILSVSETWGVMYDGGELASAKVSVTMEEYV